MKKTAVVIFLLVVSFISCETSNKEPKEINSKELSVDAAHLLIAKTPSTIEM